MRKVSYKIRKTIIGVLNLIKFILFIGGACSWVFFICGLDSEGKAGDICLAGTIISMLAVLASFACEFVVVKFLLKPHEQLCTLIDYTIYDEYCQEKTAVCSKKFVQNV